MCEASFCGHEHCCRRFGGKVIVEHYYRKSGDKVIEVWKANLFFTRYSL